MGAPVTPITTLAIILGASEHKSPQLDSLKSATNAAQDVAEYLVNKPGLALPRENLLNLFDSDQPPSEIDERISKFLKDRQQALDSNGSTARDLVFYYVGHGGFTAGDREYFLALRTTAEGREGVTSLRMVDLANTLRRDARDLRRYLVLDCCFAEKAYQYFQMSSPAAAFREAAFAVLPQNGTALLCASTASKVALSPKGERYPMFSGVLLDVLRCGNPKRAAKLSLEEIGAEVQEGIKLKFPDQSVRPVVSSPDEREGDIANIPLFPNAAREQGHERDVTPERRSVLAEGGYKVLRSKIPPAVRLALAEIKIGNYVGLGWLLLVAGACIFYSFFAFFPKSSRVGYGISASLVYGLLILGMAFLLGAMWLGRRGVFLEAREEPEPDWWGLPEIQKFIGRRYWRFLSLAIVAAWFELGLVLLFVTSVTTILFKIFGPGQS